MPRRSHLVNTRRIDTPGCRSSLSPHPQSTKVAQRSRSEYAPAIQRIAQRSRSEYAPPIQPIAQRPRSRVRLPQSTKVAQRRHSIARHVSAGKESSSKAESASADGTHGSAHTRRHIAITESLTAQPSKAAKRRKNAAHGASRGSAKLEVSQPRRGERNHGCSAKHRGRNRRSRASEPPHDETDDLQHPPLAPSVAKPVDGTPPVNPIMPVPIVPLLTLTGAVTTRLEASPVSEPTTKVTRMLLPMT